MRFAVRVSTALLALAAVAAPSGCVANSPRVNEQKGQQALARAQSLRDQGLTEDALRAFEEALAQNPKLVEAHMGIGDIRRERGDYNSASKSYEKAANLDATSFDAHYYLALMRQLVGKVKEAVTAYLQALAINPDSFHAHRNLASAYLQLGRPADALPYALRATQLQADSQAAWSNLAVAYSLLGQYDKAVDAYRQAAELGELGEPILLGLAEAHIKLGHYARAVNTLESLIRQQPSAAAQERLGYALFKLRRFEDALTHFRAALAIDAKDTSALNGLGVCLMTLYIQSGRADRAMHSEALDAWRRSVQIQPRQPRIIDLLARYQRL